MIGVESPNSAKLFYNFSLEKKVRKNHPLRKLKEILNLDFMYGLLKDKYGYNGNVSVPPPVIMKMMILLFLYNVRSEREMMETIPGGWTGCGFWVTTLTMKFLITAY